MDFTKKYNGLSLYIGNACNLRCGFCYNDQARNKNQDFYNIDRIKNDLFKYKDNFDGVVIWGGEPLMHPKILEILDCINICGYSQGITIITNGIKLIDKNFIKKLLKRKVKSFYISVHSIDKDMEDKITQRKGILEKKILGLENLNKFRKEGYRFGININITLNVYNTSDIIEILKFYSDMVDQIRISFTTITLGSSKINYNFLPKYNDTLNSFLNIGIDEKNILKKIKLSVHWAPLCVSSQLQKYNIIIREVSRIYINDFSNRNGKKLYDNQIKNKIKIKECNKCYAYGKFCFGINTLYLKKYGDKEFKSISKEKLYNIIKNNNKINKMINENK